MKRSSLIVIACLFALVTLLQHGLIVPGVVSLLTWCLLVLSRPNSIADYWNSDLVEYWLAVIAWIASGLSLVRSIILKGKRKRSSVPGMSSDSGAIQRWSLYVLGLISFIAITTPFLTPVDPNVQGNLLTTRLLSPLSVGHITEYLDVENPNSDTESSIHHWFVHANSYLLHRRISMRGAPKVLSISDSKYEVTREFPMLFLFGTDDNARDVFSRIVAGTRVSLGIGIGAALGALLIGTAIGFASGLSRGILGNIYMRLTDLFLAIPSLFLVIGILAFVGQSPITIVIVLSLSGWMGIARIVRGEVVALRDREFILAARLLGVSTWRIIIQHLVPNLRPVIITAAVLQFANAVLAEASLGFLGLGIQPPTATWGNMMGEATGYLSSAWWVGVFPGALLSLIIISAHSLGENSRFSEATKYSLKK